MSGHIISTKGVGGKDNFIALLLKIQPPSLTKSSPQSFPNLPLQPVFINCTYNTDLPSPTPMPADPDLI